MSGSEERAVNFLVPEFPTDAQILGLNRHELTLTHDLLAIANGFGLSQPTQDEVIQSITAKMGARSPEDQALLVGVLSSLANRSMISTSHSEANRRALPLSSTQIDMAQGVIRLSILLQWSDETGQEIGQYCVRRADEVSVAHIREAVNIIKGGQPKAEVVGSQFTPAQARPTATTRSSPSMSTGGLASSPRHTTQPAQHHKLQKTKSLSPGFDVIPSVESYQGPDVVRIYLDAIGKYPLLNGREEEAQLARCIQLSNEAHQKIAGDTNQLLSGEEKRTLQQAIKDGDDARRRFIQGNLRLVVSIAKRYAPAFEGTALSDIIQDGNLGLMHAVEKFDWTKGFKFSTYATWWIRQAMTRGHDDTGKTIRVPVHTADLALGYKKAQQWLSEEYPGQKITDEMMLATMKISRQQLHQLERALKVQPISLDAPLQTDSKTDGWEVTADSQSKDGFERVEEMVIQSSIADAFKATLTPIESFVLTHRFGMATGETMTLDAVATLAINTFPKYISETRERIRQIEELALTKLRHPAAYRTISAALPFFVKREEWKDDADCRIGDLPMLFAPHPQGRAANGISAEDAKKTELAIRARYCGSCVVRDNCFDYAKAIRAKNGIWGGVSFNKGGRKNT